MPEFILTDEQIGQLADDGGIIKHPALDIFGSHYDRGNATRKRLSKTQFVVIPAGKDSEDNTFKLPVTPPAPTPKVEK